MHDGPDEQTVRALPVEPLALVQRQPSHFWPHNAQDVPAHGQQDDGDVDAETQSSAAGEPDREFEGVEGCKLLVCGLEPPSEGEEADVETVEEGVEGEFACGKLRG